MKSGLRVPYEFFEGFKFAEEEDEVLLGLGDGLEVAAEGDFGEIE